MPASTVYDTLAHQYDENYSTDLCKHEDAEIARILDAAMQRAFENSYPYRPRILDVGCGTGYVADLLSRSKKWGGYGWWEPGYVGIDPAPAMLAQAKKKHPRLLFAQAEMEDLIDLDPYYHGPRGEGFDLVVSTFAFCYTSEPTVSMQGLASRMVPGGELLIVTPGPGFDSYPEKVSNHLAEGFAERYSHSAEELDKLASYYADLEHVRVTGLGYGTSFSRLERALLGQHMPNRAAYLVLEARKPKE
jgi:SAM-dependent methyltransferase